MILILIQYVILFVLWIGGTFFFKIFLVSSVLAIIFTSLLIVPYFKIYIERFKDLGMSNKWFFPALVFYALSLFISIPLFGYLTEKSINHANLQNTNELIILASIFPNAFIIHAGSWLLLAIFLFLPRTRHYTI